VDYFILDGGKYRTESQFQGENYLWKYIFWMLVTLVKYDIDMLCSNFVCALHGAANSSMAYIY
jgi:hypothetical protein